MSKGLERFLFVGIVVVVFGVIDVYYMRANPGHEILADLLAFAGR